MTNHDRWADAAGAYVLGALPAGEVPDYETHLAQCPICREEVEELRPAAEAIPMSSPQQRPPAELKARIMAEVEREAALLASAGPAADRPVERRRRRRRPLLAGWRLAPAAAAVLAVGVLAGFAIAGLGGGTSTYQATVATAQLPGARAELRVEDGEATFVADGLPVPQGAYQLWIMPRGSDTPQPSTLFLPRDGRATAAVPGAEDAEAVLVTREPRGGSDTPSEDPVVTIPLA
jgi:anti-sigma-K factor RskA